VLLGGLSDYFGRKRMFIAEMIIFVAFLALLILCNDFLSLAICLFGLGLALGCDYPTAHMIISENIPSANRGKLVLVRSVSRRWVRTPAPVSAASFSFSYRTCRHGAGCTRLRSFQPSPPKVQR
jgi:MFS family permease